MPQVFNADTDSPQQKPDDQSAQAETTASTSAEEPARDTTTLNTSKSTKNPANSQENSRKKHRPHRHVDEYSDVMRFEEPTRNPLGAYAAKPVNVFFDTQEQGEQIILLLRQSLITQIRWVLIAIFLAIFPLLISMMPFLEGLPARYTGALTVLWYLMVTGYVLESFLSWFFNVFIITDERIIDVDFYSFIFKDVSNTKIMNIEEVTAQTGGSLQTIFDFGTVFIQTASATSRLEFQNVPHPAKVTRLLNELLLEEEREKMEGRVT